MFALVWIVTLLSGTIDLAQLKFLPVAIQISVPVLFLVYLTIFQNIKPILNENDNLDVAK